MAKRTPLPPPIRVGRRFRQDLGDIAGLAQSIRGRGLIQPIVVDDTGLLLAGRRRLEAWKLVFGDAPPPQVVRTDLDPVAAEYDENVHRHELRPSELVALMRELTPAIAAASRERQKELGRTHGAFPGTPSESFTPKGRTRDLVAGLLGVSPSKLARAASVVQAAEDQPDLFGHLREQMDRTGKVDGPYRRLKVLRMAAAIRAEPPPLPSRGPYRVISVDAPWPFDPDKEDPTDRGTHPYPPMSYAQIEAFMRGALTAIAHEDVVVPFWTTNHHMPHAYRILAAVGLEAKTVLTWGKDKIGRGHYLREKTEHCIIAVRGRPTIQLGNESTILFAPRREHSEKPSAFYDLIESVYPAPRYACLFSHLQTARPRWDQHSTEICALAEVDSATPWLTVPHLVAPRDVVTTSYGTGPFLVVAVNGPNASAADGEPTWSLCLADPDARPTKRTGLPQPSSWINDLRVQDGRLVARRGDEVRVERATSPAIADEVTA